MINRQQFRPGALLLVCSLAMAMSAAATPLPSARPEGAGMRPDLADSIDREVTRALEEGKMPGCVVTIGRHGSVVYQKAHGYRRVEPSREEMTVDTMFDLASLTKPIATSTAVMQLVEQGKIRLADPVSKYLPEFISHGKEEITVEQLLVHSSGLIPDNALADYRDGWEQGYAKICALKLQSPPGTRFRYSDVGFIVLGELVSRVSGQPLDQYTRDHVFAPLGMQETTYNPPGDLAARAVTTEKEGEEWLRGKVHDPRARLMGGVAGHAGLFSTAADLSIYAQALLSGGELGGRRILSPVTLKEWTRSRDVDGNQRALGWDKRSGYSRNRGELMSPAAFGHGGFTGTSIWIDPQLDLFVIFLSNRVHPDGKGEVNTLAGRIGTIAAASCLDVEVANSTRRQSRRRRGEPQQPARLGVDVLAEQKFELLRGKRVGLIANHTSQNAAGVPTGKLLLGAEGVDLVALFSPEHGIKGVEDRDGIGDTTDETTGLPVFSLYGETRKPTPEHLEKVDVLVFDIQDIGCRFYTYLSTMGLAMEAAAEQGKEFVVLDRPNPIGGTIVEGPLLDAGKETFVGYHTIPVRHGMTVGELAQMFKTEKKLDLDLTIVEVENWRRGDYLYATGLPWVNTSPNMRSLTEAVLYPGVGLFETTNVSVGRGTDTPFEVLGAPWIDGRELARAIRGHRLPGVEVVAIRFTPDASTHKGKECGGVNFIVTNWQEFRPLKLAWVVAHSLRELHPDEWKHERFPRLLINEQVYDAVKQGKSPREIERLYAEPLQQFIVRRQEFLLY
jgi:uncharacterized protein YbbC (DUF1343 family)/CubicO group peptidase (beta-lactamase class C family)